MPARRTIRTTCATAGRFLSGSAASVADTMVPIGYGTQTSGSVIRPGAFNGVVAYKGTFAGRHDRHQDLCQELDTLGFFTRTANDLALIRAAYGHARPTRRCTPRGSASAAPCGGTRPSLTTGKNVELAVRTLRAGGAKVRDWDMPESWAPLITAHNRVMTREATRHYGPERARFSHLCRRPDGKPRGGRRRHLGQYADAMKAQAPGAGRPRQVWERFDFLLAPAAAAKLRQVSATPAIRSSTASGTFWAPPALPCPSMRSLRPAAVGAVDRACATTTN